MDFCFDGDEAPSLLEGERFDLIALDLNLPGTGDMTVLRTLRTHDRDICTLILSARSEISDRVAGPNAGVDDYLTKPFHLAELGARIWSLTLRQFTQQDVLFCLGKLSFDTKVRRVSTDGQLLSLTKEELGVFKYLLLHRGRPVSQEELLDHVWDSNADRLSNSTHVHISTLREKLRAVLGYDPITNRTGEDYVLTEAVE